MNLKRPGKFYYSNEKKVMKALGFNPVPGSGSGWIHKEDGESDVALVQLKSTDSSSYRINMLDMKKLEYHSMVSRKVPVFLVQFLKQDKIYAIVDINNIDELHRAIQTGERPDNIVIQEENIPEDTVRKVKTSKKARDKFFEERSESFGKRKR